MRIVVGSKNPTKIEGARLAFEQFFSEVEIQSVEVKTKNQPFDEETVEGALKRALLSYSRNFDFSVGIEAGLFRISKAMSGYMDFQVAAIYNGERFTIGFGPGFEYPKEVVEQAKSGIEVGKTMEIISGINEIGRKFGAIHFLSKGVISRTELSRIAVTMALIPWVNWGLYFKRSQLNR